jgi:hypothetical protein
LVITATTVKPQFKVTFLNDNGDELDVQYVEMYESAIDPTSREDSPIAIPTKDSTAQYEYTYAGWDKPLTNITSDRIIKATYTETVRKYTVQYVSRGTPVYTKEGCSYGDIVAYDVDTLPSYTGEEPYTFYLFKGWDKSGYVDGDKTINAEFDVCTYSENYFVGKDVSTLRPVELYMMLKLGVAGTLSVSDYIDPKDSLTIQLGSDVSYSNIDEKVLIETTTVFNGTNHVDTNINLLSEDRDFVLAIDYKMGSGNASNAVLAQCFSGLDTSGFRLLYNGGTKLAWGGNSVSPSSSSSTREMLVLRHIKGEHGIHVYSSNVTGSSTYYVELDGVHSMTHNVSLVFGCSKLEDGAYEQYANGTVYWSKLWYADLGDDICRQIAYWPHEQMKFEACCETNNSMKRYYLSDNSGARSSVTFIASNTLAFPQRLSGTSVNTGGWANYTLNTYLNDRLYKAFPDTWRQLMKQVKVKSSAGGKSSAIVDADSYIFIPSVSEISGLAGEPYTNEGTLISHFSSPAIRICKTPDGTAVQYWTRSPNILYDEYVYRISANGSAESITLPSATDIYVRIMISM